MPASAQIREPVPLARGIASSPWRLLSRGERATAAFMFGGIGVASFILLVATWLLLGAGPTFATLAGTLLVAYTLGLRHAVDADHIVAIDNVTRKLLQQGKRPVTVGMWFSLGHSTVVAGLVMAVVLGARWLLQNTGYRGVFGLVGTGISGAFLFLIGLVNLIIFFELYRMFQGVQHGQLESELLEQQLNRRGFLNRLFGGLFRIVNEPWQMYVVGLLFGLGFDTATEVLLLGTAAGLSVTSGAALPIWDLLLLPALFAIGMIAVDAANGLAMRLAYGWTLRKPIRRLYYNLTLTILSVLVAFFIAGLELISVVARELNFSGPVWSSLSILDFTTVGIAIVAIFVGTWVFAIAYYRYRGYDREATGPPPVEPGPIGRSG